MGLGLFLVRLVAERCGAEFSIQSTLGEGTRCLLELPPEPGNNSPSALTRPPGLAEIHANVSMETTTTTTTTAAATPRPSAMTQA
jgi:hypothetical protein